LAVKVNLSGEVFCRIIKTEVCMEKIVNIHIEKLPEGTLRAILKQANITPEEFLMKNKK